MSELNWFLVFHLKQCQGQRCFRLCTKHTAVFFPAVTRAPDGLCAAYTLPYITNKSYSLLCYFGDCQNGSWEWNATMELTIHIDFEGYARLWLAGVMAQANLSFQR